MTTTALRAEDLLSLESYARQRAEFRARVLEHKRLRRVPIGPAAVLYFEDRLTIQYQIQEMLRIERIFEPAAIAEELDAYNPLIPDGSNLKATLMIEYTDPEERRRRLVELAGLEHRVWVQVAGHPRVWAIADEDLERGDDEKTSAVHFLRFELEQQARADFRSGAEVEVGIEHPAYEHRAQLTPEVREALAKDLM